MKFPQCFDDEEADRLEQFGGVSPDQGAAGGKNDRCGQDGPRTYNGKPQDAYFSFTDSR